MTISAPSCKNDRVKRGNWTRLITFLRGRGSEMKQPRKRKRRTEIESWRDLSSIIERLARGESHWIFRGEPSTTYELRAAAGREGRSGHVRTLKYDIGQERAALS